MPMYWRLPQICWALNRRQPYPFEQAEMTPMARSFYADNRRVSNQRIKSALGISLMYPTYREGLRAILEGN